MVPYLNEIIKAVLLVLKIYSLEDKHQPRVRRSHHMHPVVQVVVVHDRVVRARKGTY